MNATLRVYSASQVADAVGKLTWAQAEAKHPGDPQAQDKERAALNNAELYMAMRVLLECRDPAVTAYLASLQERIGAHLPAAPQPLDLRPHKG